MDFPEFEFEFYSEIEDLNPELELEADNRIRELTADHTDIVGASVAIEEVAPGTTPHRYEARVIAYMRPDDVVAVEKAEKAEAALMEALDALERQVRERREKLSQTWKQP